MAIADAEPKKGEVENTSTGSTSSKGDMKKTHGFVKYSSLKDFSFSVSDVWDDLNICIFLECCHANIAELKDHNSLEENKVWEKIAKSGIDRAGSISCFNVNYCLELAKCLKNFVTKNQTKMMDNEIFKILYDNVVDLLPHFEPSSAKVPRRRSGSQDKKALEHSKPAPAQDSSEIVVEPFKSPLDSRSALKKISTVLGKFDPDDLMKSNARSAVWKEVRARTGDFFGLSVNPKAFIEGYKDSVISTVQNYPGADKDPHIRSKVFLKLAGEMLPYFDYIAPKSVKKADFLVPEVEIREPSPPKSEPKKRKVEVAPQIEHPVGEPADDPVPEPSGVTRSPAPRTYQRKKRMTEDDDPLSFLADWTTSLEENDSQPAEEQPETESKENENPQDEKMQVDDNAGEGANTQSAPSEEIPAKRPRRQRTAKEPVAEETNPAPKKVHPGRGRPKRNAPDPPDVSPAIASVPSEPEKKSNATTPPVPAASTSATTAGPLVPVKPKLVPAQEKEHPFRPPKPPAMHIPVVDAVTAEDTSDSEVEDVPLIGNHFRVHRGETSEKPRRPASKGGKMNPVVRIEKLVVDIDQQIDVASSKEVPSRKLRPGRQPRKQPSPPRAPSPVQAVETAVARRRGRPPKNSTTIHVHPVRNVRQPARPEPATTRRDPPPSTSSALVQPSGSQPPAPYMSRLTARSYEPLVPYNGQVARPDEYALRPSLVADAPEWFEKFVIETRKQEMWKVHQLMKMQNELLDAETRKRNVLEKILTALSDRYDRH